VIDLYRIFDWESTYTQFAPGQQERPRPVYDPWLSDNSFIGSSPETTPDTFDVLDRRGFSLLTPEERAYWRKYHVSPTRRSQADLRPPKFD
jgi:hypothetical protein